MKSAIPWLMSAALLAGAEPARMRADLWAANRELAGGSLLPAPTAAAPDGGDLHVSMDQIASSLELGETSMPFVFLKKGDKPADGWPLFINLHGGGGNPQASGPMLLLLSTCTQMEDRLPACLGRRASCLP